jgi:antitoxin component YwqK of YwqJK toxin-antitoxin module
MMIVNKSYYPNGKLRKKEFYRNGELEKNKEWYEDGKLEGVWFYRDRGRKLKKYKQWHENGNIARYSSSKKNGWNETKVWHTNGVLMIHRFCFNHLLEGVYKAWHESGNIGYLEFYRDGKIEGEHRSWNSSGILRTQSYYRNGICVVYNIKSERNSFLRLKNRLLTLLFQKNSFLMETFLISDLAGSINYS